MLEIDEKLSKPGYVLTAEVMKRQ